MADFSFRWFRLVVLLLPLAACGSNSSPTQPSVPTGSVGARIDSACSGPKWGVTSVTVTVDGVSIGTAAPGGVATKILPVGSHVVVGRAQNGVTWGGDPWTTTAAEPNRIEFFVCF